MVRPLYNALTRLRTTTAEIATILNEADRVGRVGDGITLALPRDTSLLMEKVTVATAAIQETRSAARGLSPRFKERWLARPGTRYKLSIEASLGKVERLCYACQCVTSFKCKANGEIAQSFHASGKTLRILLDRLAPRRRKPTRRKRTPATTYTLEFERPIPITLAAQLLNEPQICVVRKLRRCGFPITGTPRNSVAELNHVVACFQERHAELVAWAERQLLQDGRSLG